MTGASPGIGRAGPEALAAAGASVLLVGLADGNPAGVAQTMQKQGLDVHSLTQDVTAADAADEIVAAAVDPWGRVHT